MFVLSLQIHRCVQKANVGSNKKATRCQQLNVVSYSLIKRYVKMF